MKGRYGITRLGIFGSVARDVAADERDADVVVEMAPDLFGRASLKEELETILEAKVDLALLAVYESLPKKTHRHGYTNV
ncbi:MAG: nucleotidyltransferase domain-containing protein [Euryarchaeota archaeon]|nr:nucleotidyltransferase domain-containing protein [Euryarchaeota archaeon]